MVTDLIPGFDQRDVEANGMVIRAALGGSGPPLFLLRGHPQTHVTRRNKHAALKLMRKLLRKYAVVPKRLVTDVCGPTAQPPSISASTTRTTAEDERTIGPRIHISRPDGGNARCNDLRAPAQRKSSSQPTPPRTTLSTSNGISPQLNHTACYAARP